MEDSDDWFDQQIVDSISCGGSGTNYEYFANQCEKMEHGISVGMDFNTSGRDGLFNEDELFAVWEQADVDALIARLKLVKGAVV